jgi:hypothetical protein
MQNTLELVKQICPRLLVSPSFPDLVIHARDTPTGFSLQLLRELSLSVCQILPGAPRDLWEVCHAGPTATYGVGTKEGKSWETHLFPQNFPHVFQLFPRCLRFPMFFTTFSPAFHPFFHRCSPTFPPMKFTISGQAKPWCSEMVSRLRFRWLHDKISWITCCVLRKDPKGPKSVMWHILNHWTWLVT